ncbi:MAG: hypothetical protein RIC55_11880 [Pirellulaceae bacterium]
MRIESSSPALPGIDARQRAADKSLQSVFAEVLAEAGREGWRSAPPLESEAPLEDAVTQTWNDWFQVSRGRFDDLPASPSQLQQDFGSLLVEAREAGAYAAPQAFLRTLSSERLETVRHVHRLAAPIQVDGLTEEGALNLLLPPAAQIDLNFDGLTQSGVGYGIRFPDSRTPPQVAEAWQAATADLDFGERAVRQLQMKSDVLLANIHVDAEGRFSHRVEPGDPAFVNPQAAPGYSFVQLTQDRLEAIELFKNQTPPEQHQRDREFWTAFRRQLLQRGAA